MLEEDIYSIYTNVNVLGYCEREASHTKVITCDIYWKAERSTGECYSYHCLSKHKLPSKLREPFRSIKYHVECVKKKRNAVYHFGGYPIVNKLHRANHTRNAIHYETLNSGVSVTMFQNLKEALERPPRSETSDTVKEAADSASTWCLGKGTVFISHLNHERSVHVDKINDNFRSVDHGYDLGNNVIFNNLEAVTFVTTCSFRVAFLFYCI